jgi:hypothetical protein
MQSGPALGAGVVVPVGLLKLIERLRQQVERDLGRPVEVITVVANATKRDSQLAPAAGQQRFRFLLQPVAIGDGQFLQFLESGEQFLGGRRIVTGAFQPGNDFTQAGNVLLAHRDMATGLS